MYNSLRTQWLWPHTFPGAYCISGKTDGRKPEITHTFFIATKKKISKLLMVFNFFLLGFFLKKSKKRFLFVQANF